MMKPGSFIKSTASADFFLLVNGKKIYTICFHWNYYIITRRYGESLERLQEVARYIQVTG